MTLTAEKLESLITEGEIRKAVSLTRKSPSYYIFPAECYKEYKDILAPVLQKVNDIEMFEYSNIVQRQETQRTGWTLRNICVHHLIRLSQRVDTTNPVVVHSEEVWTKIHQVNKLSHYVQTFDSFWNDPADKYLQMINCVSSQCKEIIENQSLDYYEGHRNVRQLHCLINEVSVVSVVNPLMCCGRGT